MDPLSLAAGIIATIQIAERVIALCKRYLEAVQDAPSDLRIIFIEASTLKTILDNLQLLASWGHGPTDLDSLVGPNGPIEGCRRALTEISGLFPADYTQDTRCGRSKRRKVKATLIDLAWPLKETRARKILTEIMQYKTTLILAIATESRYFL